MSKIYSPAYIKKAHRATIYNEQQVLSSTLCTCFYCGTQFNPQEEEYLPWTDGKGGKPHTLLCPYCGIDAVIGDNSPFPIDELEFICACSEVWFGGYSRISAGTPLYRRPPILIEVD